MLPLPIDDVLPDLTAALTGIRSRLKPGAGIATAVWSTADKVPIITIGAAAVRKLAALPPPPPNALDPLRLADTSILSSALTAAGFKEVVIERRQVVFEFESTAAFTQFRAEVSAPFRALLDRQSPELRQRIVDAIIEAAGAHTGPDGRLRTANETILFAASC